MPSPRSSILVLSVLALLLWCAPAHAERRTALVIGNGAYKAAPLKNPTNDAQDMADALRGMGFDVTLKLNATHREMEEAVRAFGAKLKQGGLGLFYYAGHGVQVAGENYLIPVDTKVDAEADVKFGALNAGMTLARMEDAGNDLNIVILDACRTNPFARSFRTAEQGLARMDAPKGSLIAYATAPGRVAADSGGTGRNGVYTGFLLRHMRTPGLKVEEALKRVRADVVRTTGDKQVPWESSSLIGDFYFMLPQGQAVQVSVAPAPVATPASQHLEPVQPADTAPQAKVASKTEEWYALGHQSYQRGEYTVAEKYFHKAAEQGDVQSQYNLGVMYSQGKGVAQNIAEAAKWYSKSAEQGNVQAQYTIGWMYENGQGVHKNKFEAAKWYLKAAVSGHVEAQFAIGAAFDIGNGVPQSYAEAAKWYGKAAEHGDASAQAILGSMYARGEGVPQNYTDALRLLRKAANQGDAFAQFNLGLMYATGEGVPQNDSIAVSWFRKAGEHGDAKAQFNLGVMYAEGHGVVQNYSEAAKWYIKAAEQGLAEAQFFLGGLYLLGRGVAKSDSEALRWYRKAAEQGFAKAQVLLGIRYAIGKSVPANHVLAHMWFTLAAAQGHVDAVKMRDDTASKMTPAQLAEAQQMAREWKPKTAQQ